MISPETVRENPEVRALIEAADHYLDTIGYTDHGMSHVGQVAERAGGILTSLELPEREGQLAQIAGYLHDIGNVIHRDGHPQSSALISFAILHRMGMPINEILLVIGAIGNHDEETGDPISNVAAALFTWLANILTNWPLHYTNIALKTTTWVISTPGWSAGCRNYSNSVTSMLFPGRPF